MSVIKLDPKRILEEEKKKIDKKDRISDPFFENLKARGASEEELKSIFGETYSSSSQDNSDEIEVL